ncbi:MAG: alpha/beta hydrolase [Proteobacteria bacterium]|nr:MAG: alpha/beta hydrolase [Pseudomonadota bacterium]
MTKTFARSSQFLVFGFLSLFISVGIANAKTGHIRTADGTKIHYQDIGTGSPILLIPGWLMTGAVWKLQITELAKKYRVIAVDPRGQGASDKPRTGYLPEDRARDYQELVDKLKLKKPLMVGWSTGAGELLRYVEQFGDDNIGGLVLVDGLISRTHNPEIISTLELLLITFQRDRSAATEAFLKFLTKKPQTEDAIAMLKADALKTPTDAAVVILRDEIELIDFSESFKKIKKPVVFAYTPQLQKNADYLKEQLGDRVQLHRFANAGHALFIDDPKKFNQLLDETIGSYVN